MYRCRATTGVLDSGGKETEDFIQWKKDNCVGNVEVDVQKTIFKTDDFSQFTETKFFLQFEAQEDLMMYKIMYNNYENESPIITGSFLPNQVESIKTGELEIYEKALEVLLN
jgi:hypothetical protein